MSMAASPHLTLFRRGEPADSLPDECQQESTDTDAYNTSLHIASVFIILTASTVGVFMPVIASKFRSLQISNRVLTLGKQFGTGVILATGFIHMLPTAMANLSSPCLGPTFSENYTAFGGLFILLSSLFMHWIEFIAVEHNERRMREAAVSKGITSDLDDMDLGGLGATGVAAAPCPGHVVTMVEERPCRDSCSLVTSCDSENSDVAAAAAANNTHADPSSRTISIDSTITKTSPHHAESSCKGLLNDGNNPTHKHTIGHAHIEEYAVGGEENTQRHENGHVQRTHGQDNKNHHRHHHHTQEVGHSHSHGLSLLDESQRRISTYILEAGIAAHSVIIGVSLGVSSGADFTGLLIALVFHQFFEGFALGARIADLSFDTTYTHYLLAFIFSLTTPVGAAIGIGISSTYHANSKTSLLVEGIFDSISTGILLYMGYVNLLAIEFNLNGEIRRESKKMKSLCFIALWMGALAMAVIGRFA